MQIIKNRIYRPSAILRCLCFSSCLLLGLFQSVFGQITYFVASTGNDSNNGRSSDAPFQTLMKVNSLNLRAGDQILFRRGDTFRGSLFIRQSGASGNPIIIDAYGSGSKPILAGSVPVGGWNSTGGNVWQASCPDCGSRVTGLYRNASALPLGRYPNLNAANKGYLTIQSHAGKTQFTSQQALTTNFTGGEAVVRPRQWIIDRATITQQSGNTLSLNNSTGYELADGWGYFIQNHPATLDQTGEWYYDPGSKTIRLYDESNPNGQTITATAFDEGINLTNASYVTVRNLHITQTRATGLLANGVSNLVFSDNDITHSGEDGLFISGSGNNVLIENSRIEDVNNNGFVIQAYQNFTLRGNTIQRIGLWPGRGKSGDGSYTAVISLTTINALIENNVVDNVGYNGISFSTNTTVRYNRVSNFCMTKSDGGGIYTWNGNRANVGNMHVVSNIIFNGIGAPEGTLGGTYSGANGIFLDDCAQNVEVVNNTVFNSKAKGILLRGVSNITVKGNTSFNNDEEQLMLAFNNTCAIRNNVIEENVLVSRLPNQTVAAYESNANDLTSFGQFDRNVYARPFEDLFKIRAVYSNGSTLTGADLSLAEWQTRFGKDLNSKNSPITYKTDKLTPIGSALLNNTFTSNTEGWDTWSPHGNGRSTWDNANRLDGGSLQVAFPSSSGQSNSYALITHNIPTVTAGKTYQLRFDAVATSANKRVQAYLRQRSGSYRDLAPRSAILAGTTRQSYEIAFTATADEASAILVFEVAEDGQTVWLDNVRLQEATRSVVNPDEYIKLVYNATAQPSQVSLDGTYRDMKNQVRQGQITLAPFTSLILLKEESTTPPPPPPPVTLRDPENPANAVAGLDYAYYEGSWNALPDFTALTPVKTGTVGTADMSVRNRNDQFGIRFTGYVNVPTDGTYTFYTTSDDGSKLYIGSTEVVNNDGLHGMIEQSGTIGLKAGKHALTVTFFENSGGEGLAVSYSGPGLDKQVIPASAFYRVGTVAPPPVGGGTGTGLRAEYFNNPNLNAPVVLTRTDATINFDWGGSSPVPGTINADNFSIRWTGQVEAPVSGSYTFSTTTDDGVRLWVNGTQLINDWNGHAPTTNHGASLSLIAGQKYVIRMEYFDAVAGAMARLLWAYPGQAQQVVPQGRLYPAAAPPSGGGVTYLSDLAWTSMINGYGSAEKDRSNGELGSSDGRPLTLNGVTYAKGLGVHAHSELTYDLGGRYLNFITDVGIDDEINGGCGSVVFEVYLDNVLAYSSGPMNPATATKSINLNVSGKQTLKLVVTTGGDNYNCDHADWAGARLIGTGTNRLAAIEEEVPQEEAVQVYPIPARDEIRVRYHAGMAGQLGVQLLMSSAQPVLTLVYPITSGENVIRVPVQNLPRGFYLLLLNEGNRRITRKVLLSE